MSPSPDAQGPLDSPPDWEAVARYLAGESLPAERERVRAWLAAHPGDASLVRAVDLLAGQKLDMEPGVLAGWSDAAATEPAIDTEAALRRVQARRDQIDHIDPIAPRIAARTAPRVAPPAPQAPRIDPRRAARWRVVLPGMAAALVIAASIAVWRGAGDVAPALAVTHETVVGERDSLRLPDGSRVILGASSRLVVAGGYGAARREVTLEGEGFFVVEHDAARPFVVRAGSASILDLGTAFAVRTASDASVEVVVTEGSVSLARAGTGEPAGVTLRAGDVGLLPPSSGAAIIRRGAATADDVAWTQGQLRFRDASLAVVREELRRWYGVEVVVTDSSLARRRLTASLDGEPAERALRLIALALGAEVELRGDTAVLRTAGGVRAPR